MCNTVHTSTNYVGKSNFYINIYTRPKININN